MSLQDLQEPAVSTTWLNVPPPLAIISPPTASHPQKQAGARFDPTVNSDLYLNVVWILF